MAPDRNAKALKEQWLLKVSMVTVLGIALVSIGFGLWYGSAAITFDGFYNLADASMTFVALLVARLIVRGEDDRFQYGYWHLEPLLGMVSGAILAMTCVYAFVDGVRGLLAGGDVIDFGPGSLFAGMVGVLSIGMYFFMRHSAADINSEFLRIDARGWLMGGVLSFALCVSFLLGALLANSPLAYLAPYVDPAVLTVAALCLTPFPFVTLWKAVSDILQIAPADLNERVRKAAKEVADKHGFIEYTWHVARVGRQQFIEIGLVAPSGALTKSFEELDQIREEISDAMGGKEPGCWLTVDFTADRRWI